MHRPPCRPMSANRFSMSTPSIRRRHTQGQQNQHGLQPITREERHQITPPLETKPTPLLAPKAGRRIIQQPGMRRSPSQIIQQPGMRRSPSLIIQQPGMRRGPSRITPHPTRKLIRRPHRPRTMRLLTLRILMPKNGLKHGKISTDIVQMRTSANNRSVTRTTLSNKQRRTRENMNLFSLSLQGPCFMRVKPNSWRVRLSQTVVFVSC